MSHAYYNEIYPKAAAWLRELIKQGHIAPGEVDERSIEDVTPNDLQGFTQCHFFAGIGVWSHALRKAGWNDDRPIWTGSCPCQPFSSAGKGKGTDDERHLWPAFYWLIKQCRPDVVVGEQVAQKAGASWFDIVSTDLEGEEYSCGTIVFPACGVGAPHLRQRQYWLANSDFKRPARKQVLLREEKPGRNAGDILEAAGGCGSNELADTWSEGSQGLNRDGDDGDQPGRIDKEPTGPTRESSGACELANTSSVGRGQTGIHKRGGTKTGEARLPNGPVREGPICNGSINPGPTNGHWRDADWLGCRDGKWRPVEPGTFPLAHGSPARVGRLRGYGNAIVAPQAQAFIEVVQEIIT